MHDENPAAHSNPLEALQELTRTPGFFYTLARAAADNSFIRSEDIDPWTVPNTKELSLVAGLVAQEHIQIGPIPDETTINYQLEQLNNLLQEVHSYYGARASDAVLPGVANLLDRIRSGSNPPTPDELVQPLPGQALVEAFFYSGDHAYDFQYLQLAPRKYLFDSAWFDKNVGIRIDRLVRAAKRLNRLQICRFMHYIAARTHAEKCNRSLDLFTFNRADLGYLTDDEFDAFIERFSVTPGYLEYPIASVDAINEMEYKPIMRLGNDTYFMPVSVKLAEAIYESPSYWMQGDLKYKDQAADNKGKATEMIAAELLERVFPGRVYRNVFVHAGSREVAEIDVLAWAADRAIIIQAKSKGLTALSRQGDDGKIGEDFNAAVQAAYEQGLKSREAVLEGTYSLTYGGGKPVPLPASIAEAYVLCLTSSPFPVISNMLDSFLKKDPHQPYPVAMSLFDLDIVTTYLEDPFLLLHYIRHRTESPDKIHGTKEVEKLAAYLCLGPFLPEHVSGAFLAGGWAPLIDEDFKDIRGRGIFLSNLLTRLFPNTNPLCSLADLADEDSVSQRLRRRIKNPEFNHLINLLKEDVDSLPIEALFMLLDLSTEQVQQFLASVSDVREMSRSRGQVSFLARPPGKAPVGYVCFPDDQPVIKNDVLVRAEILKHMAKAEKWLCFAGRPSGAKPAEATVYLDTPWVPDPELDTCARQLFQGDSELKKLGRNDPCWCQSSLKFKKCHGVVPK